VRAVLELFWAAASLYNRSTYSSTNNIIEGSKELVTTVLNNQPAEKFKNYEGIWWTCP
jgi:hypothetical protein